MTYIPDRFCQRRFVLRRQPEQKVQAADFTGALQLILEINRSLGTTIVVVTHELSSIFTIGNNSIFLDADSKTILARGDPKELLKNPHNEKVYEFLTRGEKK